jgi:tRNA-binding protein
MLSCFRELLPFISETLTLGLPDGSEGVVLLSPTKDVPIGGKMF